jgi:hypothetical protein
MAQMAVRKDLDRVWERCLGASGVTMDCTRTRPVYEVAEGGAGVCFALQRLELAVLGASGEETAALI